MSAKRTEVTRTKAATCRTWTETEVRALGVRTDLITAGAVLGIGRTKAHELARAGEFPVQLLRLGRRYVVPVAGLLAVLGLSEQPNAPADVDERALRSVSGRGDAA